MSRLDFYLKGEMSHLLRSFGMRDVLGHLIASIPEGNEAYMVRLRADLIAAFDNYADRYGPDDDSEYTPYSKSIYAQK